ncbi:MAG: NAD-glutamate dehydrogenase [Legionellales bacterium]|nr:NAD-glutamate dehydrogenase [Legionellales bacterium]
MEIDRQTDPVVIEDLKKSIMHILHDVELAVDDWQKICTKVKEIIHSLETHPPAIDPAEIQESIAFLNWLLSDHFIFLGYRDYQLDKENGDIALRVVDGSGLGVLRDSKPGKISKHFSEMPPEARTEALSKHMLIISKSSFESRVHRAVKNDLIGIKVFDEQGNVIGEHRILGLYTSTAYNSRPYSIPVLREKVKEVMTKSKLSATGHAGKALLNILENLPRDDLFQASTDELLDLSMGILHLQERRVIRLFVRKDIYNRFVSCLVYVPKDRYSTDLRYEIQDILKKAFHADEIHYNTLIGESVLARIHFMIKINQKNPINYDVKAIEQDIIDVARLWREDLKEALVDFYNEARGIELNALYERAFPAGYRESFTVRNAVYDIEHIETLKDENDLAMSFFRPIEATNNTVRLKLFRIGRSVPLSDTLPILENMGLRVISEEPYKICRADLPCVWINDFCMESLGHQAFQIDEIREKFQEGFLRVWNGDAAKDKFNRLILAAKLDWKEINLLRTYARYLKQIKFTFSQNYIATTFSKHPELTKLLIQLFKSRFQPDFDDNREQKSASILSEINAGLESVSNLDEDKIIRRFADLIQATLRTNYFQTIADNEQKNYLSLKFSSALIPDMPLPRPEYEVWVYAARVEGVHLRSSKVARGGLRWSDRPEDFRTEILGLMKAQKVKNAVIVPSGAKGGFVPKQLPDSSDRDAYMQEAIASYKMFISGLLDLADNIIDGEIIKPQGVVCHDGDDPYWVVAADKGTATFSNYANEVAAEYGFWLDDAFASGGNTGYDHKKMGITARGAWESTKRHFREIGLNTQTENFTVIGIGDMAGDVFGNGMLLSEHIQLVAALNHLHIFIDPNPDATVSYAERHRLFHLPRSSWEDYNPTLISAGGGVFSRKAKFIEISPEMKARFNIAQDRLEPNQLIRHILMSDVDMLWNGGIGTFVKGTHELNEHVGDKANDVIRVNGNELNCKVVVEGGNLGLTQLGRVEYSLNGGHIYTDFIDNSAGVDCSDHEVNLKILLNKIVANKAMNIEERNKLLAHMTDDVAKLVLKNNYWQTQAVSIALRQAYKNHDLYVRFIHLLEKNCDLNRTIEFLPDDKVLQERKGRGQSLTSPEICVLLAYSKILLKAEILSSNVPEDAYLSRVINTAFPEIIREKYHDYMINHSLRRDIIATQLANVIINKMGITYITRVQEETGASIDNIVRAYAIAHEIFNVGDLWESVEALDYQVSTNLQIDMMLAVSRLVRRATRWLLRNHRDLSDIQSVVELYADGVSQLEDNLHLLLRGTAKEYFEDHMNFYVEGGVSEDIAKRIAASTAKFSVLDIISASHEHNLDPRTYAQIYFALGYQLELGWLRANITGQTEENHWDALAKAALRDDVDWQQRLLTVNTMLLYPEIENIDSAVMQWIETHQHLVDRWKAMIIELRSSNTIEFVKYAVAVRELLDLTQASNQSLQ